MFCVVDLPDYALIVGEALWVTTDNVANKDPLVKHGRMYRLGEEIRSMAVTASATRCRDGSLRVCASAQGVDPQRDVPWTVTLHSRDGEPDHLLHTCTADEDLFIEWFCTDRPGQQAVTDKQGNLFIGDLASFDFSVQVRLDNSNLHRVKYDARHDRYWVTQDAGEDDARYIANGLVVISPDGQVQHSVKFAADDVEALEFNQDFSFAYCGGFDGDIVVFDNRDREPRIVRTIKPFRHQIIDMTMTSRGDLVVLSQDGQMERISPDGERRARLDFDSRCVWDIQPDPLAEDGYLIATDTGVITVTLVDSELHEFAYDNGAAGGPHPSRHHARRPLARPHRRPVRLTCPGSAGATASAHSLAGPQPRPAGRAGTPLEPLRLRNHGADRSCFLPSRLARWCSRHVSA